MKKIAEDTKAFLIAISIFLMIVLAVLWRLNTPQTQPEFLEKKTQPEFFENKIHPKFFENFAADIKKTTKNFNFITSLVYDDKRHYLIIGRELGDIEIWNMTKENAKQTISKAHELRVSEIQFTTDGKSFFSSSSFGDALKLWDIQTNTLLYSIPKFHGPMIRTNINNIYLLAETGSIYFFDAQYKSLDSKEYKTSGVVQSFAIDEKTGLVAVGTASGSIDLFKILLIDKVPSLKKIASIKPYETGDWVLSVHFSTDAKSLYAVSKLGHINGWSVPSFEKTSALNNRQEIISNAKMFFKEKLITVISTGSKKTDPNSDFVEVITLSSNTFVIEKISHRFSQVEYIPSLNKFIAIDWDSVKVIDFPY